MATLITRNSDTPTISNNDYARMIRFSCGGYNGITKGYGQECKISVSANNIKIANGEIIWQGWQTLIGANGEIIPIDIVNNKRYYSLYLKIDLSISNNQSSSFEVLYSTVNYPGIDCGDDLTTNPNGIAKALVAHFTATNGVISEVSKVIKVIDYNVCPNLPQTDRSERTANTEYVRQAISDVKNIVVGSSVINPNITVGTNIVKRQVNFVYLDISMPKTSADTEYLNEYEGNDGLCLATLPVGFRPKTTIYSAVQGIGTYDFIVQGRTSLMATIYIDGRIIISVATFGGKKILFQRITCGFEIK